MIATGLFLVSGLFGTFVPQKSLAVTVTDRPPAIDGVLDDEVWKTATPIEGMVNFEPIESAPMSQRTIVRIARDDRNLYLAFDCKDTEPQKVRATFADRDAMFGDDWVMVVLDPFEDERRGVLLVANPYGIQADLTHDDTSGGNEDATWDAIWYSAGRTTADGYTVEIAIPFGSLRFDPAHDGWGFNVVRRIARDGEKGSWAPVSASGGPLLHQDAELTGMRGLPIGVTAGIIPELTVRGGPAVEPSNSLLQSKPGDGPWNGRAASDLGVTGKFSRAGTVLDLTLHPDFSQIESDPAKLTANQRFALYYDEKRPFFQEGRSYFTTPETIVYTRTIVDPVYGLKLTGKEGSTAFAFLNAVDQSPADSTVDARWNHDAYGRNQAVTIAARAATDIAPGATLGIIAADKHVGSAWNRVGGVDTNYSNGSWNVGGQSLWSATDHPTGESDDGDAERVAAGYSDRHIGSYSWVENISRGFRAEAGFLPRVGYTEGNSDLYYRWETGRKTGLLAWRIGATVDALESSLNSDATRDASSRVRFEFGSMSYWIFGSQGWERFSDTVFQSKTRSGFQASGAPWRWLNFNFTGTAGDEVSYFQPANPYLGRSATMEMTTTVQPIDRLNLAIGYSRKSFVTAGWGEALREIATRGEKSTAFDASVANVSAQYFFTEALSTRVFTHYDDFAGKVGYSALLSWRPSPGTVTYLGYQDARPTHSGVDVSKERALFFKLSWLFRY